MGRIMYSLEEVKQEIALGKNLLLAGDEQLLAQLPSGNWIGGTTPYFMTEEGAICSREKIHVTELAPYVESIKIAVYNEETIPEIYREAPDHGFSIIIIPAKSKTHLSFALNAPNYEGFAFTPLVGWVSCVHMDDLGHVNAKVFSGPEVETLEEGAVVMHVSLPKTKVADIGIVNIFEQGNGDNITFDADGFSAREACINGQRKNLSEYIKENSLDRRLPLVADYCGAMINTSFQEGNDQDGEVKFYAPVFRGVSYRHAKPASDPLGRFAARSPADVGNQIQFSCYCYYELDGKRTEITGPATFGEIAYQLLNQTTVYLRIVDLSFSQ